MFFQVTLYLKKGHAPFTAVTFKSSLILNLKIDNFKEFADLYSAQNEINRIKHPLIWVSLKKFVYIPFLLKLFDSSL